MSRFTLLSTWTTALCVYLVQRLGISRKRRTRCGLYAQMVAKPAEACDLHYAVCRLDPLVGLGADEDSFRDRKVSTRLWRFQCGLAGPCAAGGRGFALQSGSALGKGSGRWFQCGSAAQIALALSLFFRIGHRPRPGRWRSSVGDRYLRVHKLTPVADPGVGQALFSWPGACVWPFLPGSPRPE